MPSEQGRRAPAHRTRPSRALPPPVLRVLTPAEALAKNSARLSNTSASTRSAGRSALRRIHLGDALATGGSAVVFVASFGPFISYDSRHLTEELRTGNLATSFSAWSGQTFMAPLTWFVALASLLVIAVNVARYLVSRDFRLLSFTLPQLQLMLAFFSATTMVGYGLSYKGVVFGTGFASELDNGIGGASFDTSLSLAAGGQLMVLAALVALAGAVLTLRRIRPARTSRAAAQLRSGPPQATGSVWDPLPPRERITPWDSAPPAAPVHPPSRYEKLRGPAPDRTRNGHPTR